MSAAPPNVHDPEWAPDPGRSVRPGFMVKRAFLGRQAGAHRLGASVWEVEPGQAAYPYHFHLAEEELLVVLEGEGRLRTPDGWRPLARGEVVAFPAGDGGAHQVLATGSTPMRFLAVSTNGAPDIVVYPDSGKVGAFERRPDGGGMWELFRRGEAVDYWEGEEPPAR